MIDPSDDMPGTLLTDPKQHGRLRVTPLRSRNTGRTTALRVEVFSDWGRHLVNLRATETEATIIDVPDPNEPGTLRKHPGTLWFYGPHGAEIGFLPDRHRDILNQPMALERPRQGPTGNLKDGARK